jgi:hypothetical protein
MTGEEIIRELRRLGRRMRYAEKERKRPITVEEAQGWQRELDTIDTAIEELHAREQAA